jgi:hypothetical protein
MFFCNDENFSAKHSGVGFDVHYERKIASWRQQATIEAHRFFYHSTTITSPKKCYKENKIVISSFHPIKMVSRVVWHAKTLSIRTFNNQVLHLMSFYLARFCHISSLQNWNSSFFLFHLVCVLSQWPCTFNFFIEHCNHLAILLYKDLHRWGLPNRCTCGVKSLSHLNPTMGHAQNINIPPNTSLHFLLQILQQSPAEIMNISKWFNLIIIMFNST